MFLPGWTDGDTSPLLRTEWTNLENSLAFGVKTARRYLNKKPIINGLDERGI
jgi:hypothetical protein